MKLIDAFMKIRGDLTLEAAFKASPKDVLASLGVDTSSLKVSQKPAGGTSDSGEAACWSVGCVACYSQG
jgi:hypothetical protein